jgi:tetratricopeptide (TPR) repeat protein
MHDRFKNRLGKTLATVSVALLMATFAPQAVAMTAEQYFADGNRLFEDDLYWAALLRFRQASEAGMDTPLLHYNMGVSHYRAGQHIRARDSLLKATASPKLRVVTHYNLGLNAYALGETEEALRWFRMARDQQESEKIAKYAVVAISRVRDAQEPDALEQRVVKRKKEQERQFANLRFYTKLGFGTDDNVFRTPGQDYIDFSDPNLPLVTPEVQSGAFIPISLGAKYKINSYRFEGFFGAYRLSGRYYQDKELENANEYFHEFSFGSQFRKREENRSREVYSAFTIAQHDEVYYDPDNGAGRTLNGESIEDRMNYVRYGPELAYRRALGRFSYGFDVVGQLWNYEKTIATEWDHEYFRFDLNTQYKFTSTSLLRINVANFSRRFGDRPSFDLDGVQRIGNPNVRYDYLQAEVTARQRITANMWFGVSYEVTDRRDHYVGYNDYTRNSYGFEFHWSPGDRFDFDIESYYRIYDFPNAFAFHNPVAGTRTQESARGRVQAAYRFTNSISVFAEGKYRGTASSDTRISYDRYMYMLGIRWEPY